MKLSALSGLVLRRNDGSDVQITDDLGVLWAGALWRATVPCVAIVLLLGAWTFFASPTPAQGDLSQDFENTVLAAANQQASDSIW